MKLPLSIAVCAGLMVSGAAQSGEIKLNQQFSGVGLSTALDTNDDGSFANMAFFELKGSPGRGTLQAQGESTPFAFDGGDCPAGDLQSDLLHEAFVETFDDLSMLFYEATSGYSCVDLTTGEIGGELSGVIVGGTGRFLGATGSWTIDFEVFLIGQTVTAFVGTAEGTIEVPD